MSLINWRRGDLLPSFNSMVENFFDNDNDFEKWWKGAKTIPAVNVVETDKSFDMEVAAPGMKKEDFKVEVKEGMLMISAETKHEEEETKENYTRREFSYSSFNRSFRLPENVKADNIVANYKDGILKLTMPKKVASKPEETVKKIAIS
ncbi:MAG: Hsp20/alpha crystallin family protein [Saprospiraceae bacterium]|nr:Hsp20/alpha crystallin family protein [Saprospiraceae bacterium]